MAALDAAQSFAPVLRLRVAEIYAVAGLEPPPSAMNAANPPTQGITNFRAFLPEGSLELVREGYRAALIEAGGALPAAGEEDDWAHVDRRQALRMRLREAELLEKMGRNREAAETYHDLEQRIPRDNRGMRGRAKAAGRLN